MSLVKDVVSRKYSKCKFCLLEIPRGTLYTRIKITPWCHPNNEGFAVWKVHKDCYADGMDFFYDDLECGVFPPEAETDERVDDFRKKLGLVE